MVRIHRPENRDSALPALGNIKNSASLIHRDENRADTHECLAFPLCTGGSGNMVLHPGIFNEVKNLINLNYNVMYTMLVLIEFHYSDDFYAFYIDIKVEVYNFRM